MPSPRVPTTPEQWSVIAWTAVLLLLSIGAIAIYYALRTPLPAADTASRLRNIAYTSWGLAGSVVAIRVLLKFILR